MAKKDTQMGLLDGWLVANNKRDDFLIRVNDMIDWKPLAGLVDGLCNSKLGRPAWPGEIMIKMCVLQQFYNLSDPELEVQAADRLSFLRFVGIGIADKVPDETSMVRFRERLREAKLDRQIFESINNQLMSKGFIVKQATIIDATLIQANAKPPSGDREATDRDAKFTVKAGKPHYGYKMHVAVDAEYGVIRDLAFTPANVHDRRCTEPLVPDDPSVILADKAYYNEATEQRLGRRSLILYKAFRNRPLDSIKEEFNRMASSLRSRIERTFGYLKHWAGYARVRYFGIQANESEAFWRCLSYNLLNCSKL
jgi:transposase, IS5 family